MLLHKIHDVACGSKSARMNFHIAAKPGDIAETVLISGDPMRIKHMAEVFLSDAFCFNEIRGMYGYTGMYKGKRVSMMGTGIDYLVIDKFIIKRQDNPKHIWNSEEYAKD